ncbi:pimeloyl-ACP methyl ester carboxylesterase [Murinocardiopsis flavida]|uniref:Pimeloyl-ACP methyl ester carboxylesterase n=1 Tax=Murinocardiopsis flavida TaxID=645275 RepID=A0A2P8DJH3_9ACTN|nr:alpha/beta hydrolase [Murinocardiopsis flavida]PSK97370.1 pimeloyl-ACP methyl ester carboxylesterase [Murinocardiopsis flavida]
MPESVDDQAEEPREQAAEPPQGEPETGAWPGELMRLAERDVFVRTSDHAGGRAAPHGRNVYLHGLAGSSTNWTELMGLLGEEFPGAAVDLPGFGESPAPADGDYRLDAQAECVVDLISRGGRPVNLVGNSMGGSLAVRIAAEHPELVRTLVLVSPALPDLYPRLVPYQMTSALVPVIGPAVFARMQSRPPEVRVQGTFDATYFDPAAVPMRRVREALRAEQAREALSYANVATLKTLRSLVAEYLRRGPRGLWRQAAEVRCPAMLVYARHDKFIHPRMAVRAARTFSKGHLVLLSKAGHVAMMERPDVLAERIRPFLRDAARLEPGAVHRIT